MQVIAGTSAAIRIQRVRACNYVVEAKLSPDAPWDFIRICHLETPVDATVHMGVYACSPSTAGGSVELSNVQWLEGIEFEHTN